MNLYGYNSTTRQAQPVRMRSGIVRLAFAATLATNSGYSRVFFDFPGAQGVSSYIDAPIDMAVSQTLGAPMTLVYSGDSNGIAAIPFYAHWTPVKGPSPYNAGNGVGTPIEEILSAELVILESEGFVPASNAWREVDIQDARADVVLRGSVEADAGLFYCNFNLLVTRNAVTDAAVAVGNRVNYAAGIKFNYAELI
jgi:hypothetical protein